MQIGITFYSLGSKYLLHIIYEWYGKFQSAFFLFFLIFFLVSFFWGGFLGRGVQFSQVQLTLMRYT